MSSFGPSLPPALTVKRKRPEGADDEGDRSHSSSPTQSESKTPDSPGKRPRTIGPTLPPAPLDERPTTGPEVDSESSDDDDFGPSLPPTGEAAIQAATARLVAEAAPQAPEKSNRDEWMIVPPSNGDWSSRIDPTKVKNRKFNSGKGAKAPVQGQGGGVDNKWLETPAEKIARLEREVLGIQDTSTRAKKSQPEPVKVEAGSQKIREYTEKTRGSTLYNEHQKTNPREKEDDPSARAFDREKDIAGGMKINTTQRNELMKKAADFGTRFSSAKYL